MIEHVEKAQEATRVAFFPSDDHNEKIEQHVKVIKLYSRWLLGCLVAWMVVATLTFWTAGVWSWDLGVSLAVFCVAPILALTLVLSAIAHHAFRNDPLADSSSTSSDLYKLIEKLIGILGKSK